MRFSRLATPLAMLSVFSMFVTAGCSSSSTNTASVGGSTAVVTTGGATSTTPGGATSTAVVTTGGKTSTTPGGATSTTPGGATSTIVSTSVGGSTAVGGTTGIATSSTGGVSTTVGGAGTGGVTVANGGGGAAATGGVAPSTGGTKPVTSGGAGTSLVTGGAATVGGAGGGGGAGGATSAGATLNDLIAAICHWEFSCCNAGEAKWELGPLVTTEAQCVTKFQYLLNSDNTAISASPYPSSYAVSGLLSDLAYRLNPANITENPQGIQQCVDFWKTQACEAALVTTVTTPHCSATSYGLLQPCALTNLVKPKLAAGSICNVDLAEGAANDVECVAGTTCLAAGAPGNPSTSNPTCVTRGVAAGSCTLDADCDFNFYCNAGTCAPKGGPGEACSYKDTAPIPGSLSAPCKPGLSCNPVSKTCIQDCTANYVCNSSAADGGDDFMCPAGNSCIPITVGNDSTSFKVCSAIGAAAGAKCNSLEDCGAGMYCAGTSCAPRQGLGLACSESVPGNCVTGMYCTAGSVCASYVGNGKACTQAATSITSTECDPTTAIGCVYLWDTTLTTPAASYICSNALLANAQRCGNDFDCASNRCEFATLAATFRTCIAGAIAGAACDATQDNGEHTRCGVGLTCNEGQCVAQVGPGGNCESISAPGTADNTLCQNSSCDATKWKNVGTGSPIMCTDAPVPVSNGGLGVTCDGATK